MASISRRAALAATATVTVLAALATSGAAAQGRFPEKPVRMIVPAPPGSGPDSLGRLLGTKLGEIWGQSVVVENVVGAGGAIGHERGARAAPDGYTMTMGLIGPMSVTVNFGEKMSYDPVKDFAPVTLFGSSPYIVLVHPSVPVTSMKELVAHAKARPGQVNYASAGNASLAHLGTELFSSMAGIKMNHVPYKSSALSVLDLVAGRIDLLFGTPAPVLPHLRAGKLRALAATSPRRASFIPELPTVAEAGFPGYSLTLWFGLFAPAGTPGAVIERLNAGTRKVLSLAETRDALALQGLDPAPTSPSEFAVLLGSEIARWRKAAALANRTD
jgi:tripartite-type tricarboxylate transporter receptor subunit TctC